MIETIGDIFAVIGVIFLLFVIAVAVCSNSTTQKSNKEKVYDRISAIIAKLHDINPKISEIKHVGSFNGEEYFTMHGYHHDTYQKFEVSTGAGSRYLAIYDGSYTQKLKFLDGDNTLFNIECDKSSKRYNSDGSFDYDYSVEIKPNLDADAPMNEEQIFNCLVEIEQIFEKYQYSTKKAEHKANVNKFISRFGGN